MTRKILLAVTLFVSLTLHAGAQTNQETKVFDILHADPDRMVEVLTKVCGDQVRLTPFAQERKLVATGTSNQLAQVASLLSQLDIPVMNVRIDVAFLQSSSKSSKGSSISGTGKAVITPSGKNSYKVDLSPQLHSNTEQVLSNARQTLVVKSGKNASLFVGQQAPYANWLLDYARQTRLIEQEFEIVNVGSSLRIEPVIIGSGPLINVKLTPELTGLAGKKSQRIQYTGLTTEITARDGETITIGGLGKDEEFTKKFLVGFDSNGEVQSLNITLTPHIIDPSKPSAAR